MRNSLRLGVLFTGASIFAGAGFLIACGDDTSINPVDGGGTDASNDAPIPSEASPGDGGADTAPPFDGGFVVETFDRVFAKAFCGSLARCCYGTSTPPDGGVDGGSFDEAACEAKYSRVGFEGSNADRPLRDAGNVTLNQVSADACITKINAASCNLPGSEFKSIRTACFAAYAGIVVMDGACTESIECKPGQFCKPAGDSGTGTCTPIRAIGGTCGDIEQARSDEACSYRAGGDTGNYCNIFDLAGVEIPMVDRKCAAAKGAGSDCVNSRWCEETICSEAEKCVTPDMYFASGCGEFVK